MLNGLIFMKITSLIHFFRRAITKYLLTDLIDLNLLQNIIHKKDKIHRKD